MTDLTGVVDGLFAIARALDGVARELKYLGNGNANTEMGAIEAHGKAIKDAFEGLGVSISEDISFVGEKMDAWGEKMDALNDSVKDLRNIGE